MMRRDELNGSGGGEHGIGNGANGGRPPKLPQSYNSANPVGGAATGALQFKRDSQSGIVKPPRNPNLSTNNTSATGNGLNH